MIAPALELVGVSAALGQGANAVKALRDVSLALSTGELVAVTGPSGSGKSTLIHVAAGLIRPSAGEVRVDGTTAVYRNHRTWAELRRRRIGVVFQRLNLIPTLTVLENVMVPLILDGCGAKDAEKAARAALVDVGVNDLEGRLPHEISGGEQQRAAIARALVGDRGILLADEPTGALDTVTGEAVLDLLAQRAAAGAAVLFVTHDSRLTEWADRVVYLSDGAVIGGPRMRGASEVRADS